MIYEISQKYEPSFVVVFLLYDDIDGMVQECTISVNNIMEILHLAITGIASVYTGCIWIWYPFRPALRHWYWNDPDSKVPGVNMGPTWVLSIPDGPYVDLMNLAIRGWHDCPRHNAVNLRYKAIIVLHNATAKYTKYEQHAFFFNVP